MKTLIKSATILDATSKHHGKKRDVLLEGNKIIAISAGITDNKAKEINGKGLCLSAGWIDMRAHFCDPGLEYKEDLNSGTKAAARGGFTTVVLMPSTHPVADNKGAIEYTLAKTKNSTVRVLPCGTLSEKMQGKQLSEMYDMHTAGAIAYTDDKQEVSTELMSKALEYSKNFGGLVISFPYDRGLCAHGQINEGATSVQLGMKGIPHLAEEMQLMRDIELLRYSGGRLHVSLISTAKSVDLIRKAKKEKLHITCSIAAHQLSYTDSDLHQFDSNLKVLPPLRTAADNKALIAGLKDGTIDCICSDHTPEDVEHKVREFEDANFGISGIETAFCAAYTALAPHLTIEEIIEKFTTGPAQILNLKTESIAEGNTVPLTLFSTAETTTFTKAAWLSKSTNSPFIEKELKGKVMATF